MTERARIVVGADGRNSSVARAVQPEAYNSRPAVGPAFYSYWSGVGSSGFEVAWRGSAGMAAFPTHDDLTLVIVGLPQEEFDVARSDVEGAFRRTMDLAPELGERVRSGRREERFRRPYGPGWALVGDAGYHLHPITAQGITDAFLDAERLAGAIDDAFTGRRPYAQAMAAYQAARDAAVMPMYEMTFELAKLEPPPLETQQLLAAVAADPVAADDFVSVQAGTLPIPPFFHPDNVARILAGTAPASP